MDVNKKRVAIVGAGPSGLTACKHVLAKGFRPVVFEAADAVGGVWTRTLASTRLQTPAAAFRFSDFPWPADVEDDEFPRNDQVAAYMAAYARQFGVLECVRFGSRVLGAEYAGASEQEVAAWERWSGNGEAFGDGTGEWHLTVKHGECEEAQTYKFDFLILCVGRYAVAKHPKFPHEAGPEVFHGQVLHSMDFSRMPHADADELIRGKRSKYPCTLVYRTANWTMDPNLKWGPFFEKMMTSRLAELMVHKPGEGFVLSLLATVLTPIRWLIAMATETYYKALMPMRKHGMVPDHSFSAAMLSWRISVLPDRFYDAVDEGGIVLKRCDSFSFGAGGVVLDGTGERVDADVVILATGFDADRLLSGVFASPWFREIIVAEPSDTMLPLYRHCVHPRIPQMAVVGYAESEASIYPYEMMAKWVVHLLDGTVRLPSVAAMERSVSEWESWGQWVKRRSGGFFLKSSIATATTWYHDQLCRDMGYSPRRKRGEGFLADWLQPYGPTDYAGIQ
ncbi:hypothetical protein SEVIR_6G155800v4 [Setaria viridis]|uniref:Flavin-containing monooxygenase n=1 Tax=Setaria viridis TaxID=4556 RepID=A0A4U6U465_SETVI|nr:hypothetical protein SEVIR_6G155800v2 [Setaria viridis]